MLDKETLLTVFDGTVKSLIFNLDFIPADKLDWKPTPEAKSALEIVNHLAHDLDTVSCSLEPKITAFTPATNADEAKRMLNQVAERFITAVRAAAFNTLSEQLYQEKGYTKGWRVSASIMDTVYHSGQIEYIQSLCGDAETHFDATALTDLRRLWQISPSP